MSTGSTDSDRNKHLLRIARISLGIVFLILGIIGSLLPILQGWIFFLLALIAFFPDHPKVERVLEKAEPKFPRLVHGLRKLGIGDPPRDEDETSRFETGSSESASGDPSDKTI